MGVLITCWNTANRLPNWFNGRRQMLCSRLVSGIGQNGRRSTFTVCMPPARSKSHSAQIVRRVRSASVRHLLTEPVGSLPFFLSHAGALLGTNHVPCLLLLTPGGAPDNPTPAETFRHMHAAAP